MITSPNTIANPVPPIMITMANANAITSNTVNIIVNKHINITSFNTGDVNNALIFCGRSRFPIPALVVVSSVKPT